MDQKIQFRVIWGRVTAFHDCPEGINSVVASGESFVEPSVGRKRLAGLVLTEARDRCGEIRCGWYKVGPGVSTGHQKPSETSAALGMTTW